MHSPRKQMLFCFTTALQPTGTTGSGAKEQGNEAFMWETGFLPWNPCLWIRSISFLNLHPLVPRPCVQTSTSTWMPVFGEHLPILGNHSFVSAFGPLPKRSEATSLQSLARNFIAAWKKRKEKYPTTKTTTHTSFCSQHVVQMPDVGFWVEMNAVLGGRRENETIDPLHASHWEEVRRCWRPAGSS